MGQLRRLDKHGDTRTDWDPSKPEEVEAARLAFNLYRSQGYAAARMENDRAGKIIREFNPNDAVVIFIPALQGG